MSLKNTRRPINRVDVQVSIFTAAVVILSCLCIYGFHYHLTYSNMIQTLVEQTQSIHAYVDASLSPHMFSRINTPDDMDTRLYRDSQQTLYNVKQVTGVQYLYTAKQNEDGSFIYVVDGLDPEAEDFRRPGDPIEPEIIPELERALRGEPVLPDHIKDTGWGKIFIAYLPIHSRSGVIGVLGLEFHAESQYNTYRWVRIITPVIALLACVLSAFFAVFFFRRISNPTARDLYNTDYLTQLKNRNAFDTDLNNLTAQRRHTRYGVLVIDLNYLKRVNDSMGHTAGDRYLKTAARTIQSVCPPLAACYRTGGDEFAILVPSGTVERLGSLKAALECAYQDFCPDDWMKRLSLSVGYAAYDGALDASLRDTYHRADQAMYQEKKRFHDQLSEQDRPET